MASAGRPQPRAISGRIRLLLGCVLALAALLAGCTTTTSDTHEASSTTAVYAPSTTATRPPSSTARGAVVTGLPASRRVTVTDEGQTADPGKDARFASHIFDLGPSGPLVAPATVILALTHPVAAGTSVVVATRERGVHRWSYLPATLTGDRAHARFTTRHFSLFGVLVLNLKDALMAFKIDFIDGIDSGATSTDTPKPSCDNEVAARSDGYTVTSSSTDTLYWCLGVDATGSRYLKVTDHRRYPLEVTHPNMDVETDRVDWGQFSSLSRLISGQDAIIAPDRTVVFNADLSSGGSEGISTQMDGLGQSLYALQTAVETLVSILTRFGATAGAGALKVANTLLSIHSCASAMGQGSGALITSCFSPADILEALGVKGLLLAPLMATGAMFSFFRSEWNALVDQFNNHDQYALAIKRAAPSFATVAGLYYGHTRSLRITSTGVATESIGDGCCDPQIDVTYHLSNLLRSGSSWTASATSTAVHVHPGWPSDQPAPRPGQVFT